MSIIVPAKILKLKNQSGRYYLTAMQPSDYSSKILDSFLPAYQWRTHHSLVIHSAPEKVKCAFQGLTNADLRIGGLLFKIRLHPSKLLNRSPLSLMERTGLIWNSMVKMGFMELLRMDDGPWVLGFIGQPWKLKLENAIRKDVRPEAFTMFGEPNYIKGVNSVTLVPHPQGTLLTTETRVWASCHSSESKFKPYWFFIKPFSGLMRRDMLNSIARKSRLY